MEGMQLKIFERKRSVSDAFTPSAGVIAIWLPLLSHICTLHPSFASILVSRVITAIVPLEEESSQQTEDVISLSGEDNGSSRDASYELCAASWANWLLDSFEDPAKLSDEDKNMRRTNAVVNLVSSMGMARKNEAEQYQASVNFEHGSPHVH
jgi:ribosomal biogenesis protein LAS1